MKHTLCLQIIKTDLWRLNQRSSHPSAVHSTVWFFSALVSYSYTLQDGRDWRLPPSCLFYHELKRHSWTEMSDNNPLLCTINPLVTWISGMQQSERHIKHSAHTECCCWTWKAGRDCCFQNVKTTNSSFVPVRSLSHRASVKWLRCVSNSVCSSSCVYSCYFLKYLFFFFCSNKSEQTQNKL